MLGHKINLEKFKKIEIISSIFSKDNDMKLEINYKKKTGKLTNMWRLNNMLRGQKRYPKRNQKYFETNENGNIAY